LSQQIGVPVSLLNVPNSIISGPVSAGLLTSLLTLPVYRFT
jgi:hypothetical protein